VSTLRASVSAWEPGPVITLSGEVDITTAAELSNLITGQLADETQQLIIDVAGSELTRLRRPIDLAGPERRTNVAFDRALYGHVPSVFRHIGCRSDLGRVDAAAGSRPAGSSAQFCFWLTAQIRARCSSQVLGGMGRFPQRRAMRLPIGNPLILLFCFPFSAARPFPRDMGRPLRDEHAAESPERGYASGRRRGVLLRTCRIPTVCGS
jgi:hypothetical protein